jgi:hypothetical protein
MRKSWRVGAMVLAVLAGGGAALVFTPPADAAKPLAQDDAAGRAAREFLATLSPELRKAASFAADSPERLAWHYVPKDRVGVSMLQLDDPQSEALGSLLATALSPEGLLTARGVIKHENILRRVETESGIDATRRDPGRYHTAIFGKPGPPRPGPGASRGITSRSTSRSSPASRRSSRRCSSVRTPRRC